MPMRLSLANHASPADFWKGGMYSLNLTFDRLRDAQWATLTTLLWELRTVDGPYDDHYVPSQTAPTKVVVEMPPAGATLTQYGSLWVPDYWVGCAIQMTRSLFEGVSILIPIGMFEELRPSATLRTDFPQLAALDEVLYQLALSLYDAVPFSIGLIGYERECPLPDELRYNAQVRHDFLVHGNFMATDSVLQLIEPDLTPYQPVRANLRWMPPQQDPR